MSEQQSESSSDESQRDILAVENSGDEDSIS